MTFEIPNELAWHVSEDQASTFVTSVALGRVIVLSETASAIWRTAHRASTMDEIIDRLGSDRGLEPSVIADDVELCLNELVEYGILKIKGSSDDDR